MIDIRLPNITGADAATQMSEVKSYLYQMVEQLNWALNTLETGGVTTSGSTAIVSGSRNGVNSGGDSKPSDVLENFGALKSLIIKTAEATNNEIVRLDDAINAIQAANKSIDTVTESYYKSTSPTELVGGAWADTYPGWEQGTYIWTRSTVTYSDGSAPTITEPVCVTGAPGAKGDPGTNGTNGKDGADGKDGTPGKDGYTPIKGVDYFDGTPGKDGTNGKDGAPGKDGVDGKDGEPGSPGKDGAPGKDGVDGADGKDGTSIEWKGSFNAPPANPQKGWAYYNTKAKASYTYNGEAWYQMSIDGVDGANGKDGVNGADGKDGISVVWKGELSSPPAQAQENWVYKDTDDGKVYIYHDAGWELMVADGNDGKDGANGTDGVDGVNGMSVFITYHDSSDTPNAPTGDGTTGGWHTDATGSAVWLSQKVAADASSGTWGAPIKIKGDPGKQGEQGETGVGIASVDVEYRLSDSDAELSEGHDWQTTIETIPDGMSLWSRTKVTYTDGTVAYAGLSCISKYNIETVAGAIDDAVREGCDGVYSYIEAQEKEYKGLYYARSDYGEFLEEYNQVLSIDPTKIEQAYSDIQYLIDNTETIGNTLAATTANIKTGKLYEENGIPVYGVEVGQTTEVNGSEVFNKFARFTSGKLTFYDQDGGELSWISDYKLYITNAQITGDMWMGGYKVDTSNGIAFIWSGG